MKHRLLILCSAICLLLSGCNSGARNRSDASSQAEAATLTAEFTALEDGLASLKTKVFGSSGWSLYSGGEYLIAAYDDALVRYSIAENNVDHVVRFERPRGWWCSIILSPDGEAALVKAGEHPEYRKWTNQVLVDFREKSCRAVEEEYALPKRAGDSNSIYEIELRRDAERMFYRLTAEGKSLEIRSVPDYAMSLGAYAVIDENRMGVLFASSKEANGYLGYDTFAVIDISQDEIIQQHTLNQWDEEGVSS